MLMLMFAAHKIDSLRPHIHSVHDLRAAFFHGNMLKEFSYTIKQHYSGAFSEITDAEGSYSGD